MTSLAASFRRRFFTLALQVVALLTLSAVAASMTMRVREIADAVAWTSASAQARMHDEHARGASYDAAAAKIVAEYAREPIAIGVYDADGRLVAGRIEPGTGVAAFFGLHLVQTPLPRGAVVVSVASGVVLRDIAIALLLVLPVGALAVVAASRASRALEHDLLERAAESARRERAVDIRSEERMRRFVADAGHELRTPLTVIIAYAEILASSVADAAAAQAIRAIRAEGRRMRVLIDKLITLARLETPPVAVPTRPVNVTLLAEELCAALAPIAQGRLQVHAADDHLVDGEEGELREALRAVVENALAYAPDGPVEIALARDSGEPSLLVVTVRDRGPGFADDELPLVFNRFFRGRAQACAPDGAGLGLAIARVAAERAGGTIAARTRPDGGAELELRIPELRARG